MKLKIIPLLIISCFALTACNDDKKKEEQATDGTLYCAGMIAGEGLVGILLAILAVVNVSSVFDLSGSINLGNAGGVILMLLMILSLLKFSIWNKKKA